MILLKWYKFWMSNMCGWITTKLQYNRGWTWRDIKNWLVNNCGTQSPERFYYGDNNTSWSATTSQWEDYYSLNTYGKGLPL